MIETLGWIALGAGGAWLLGGLTMFLLTGAGLRGLESIPAALAGAAVVAATWIALVIWWSPIVITVGSF